MLTLSVLLHCLLRPGMLRHCLQRLLVFPLLQTVMDRCYGLLGSLLCPVRLLGPNLGMLLCMGPRLGHHLRTLNILQR